MSRTYYVYEWIRLDTNEPFYVGKGCKDRWRILDRGNNHHFNNIVNSIPVAVNILHDNLNEETAYGLECYYIYFYRDVIGYNMCNISDGGEGCVLVGENHPMYGKHPTEETKAKISEALKGENHPMYGKHHSEEAKKKMSEKALGRKHTEESKQRISKKIKGKKRTEENKKNISIGIKKRILEKGNNRQKDVICLTTKKIFSSAKKGGEFYNINSSGIIRCCKLDKNYKYCGKFNGQKLVWRYLVWKHNKKYRIKIK